MKVSLILLRLVLCLPLMAADKKPLTKEESAKVIEAAIRKSLKEGPSAVSSGYSGAKAPK